MTPFEQGWFHTGPKEGGFSNHPADRGGPTMWGVTERVARAAGYAGPMQLLPEEQAQKIAKAQYWDVLNLDAVSEVSLPVALEMFDTQYNGGEPGQWLQRCLNLFNQRGKVYPDMAVDGRIGPMTVQALRSFIARRGKDGEVVLVEALNHLQGARFIGIAESNPTQEDFIYGWLKERASSRQ